MPELPEVQTVVNTLRPKLLGRVIKTVVVVRSDVIRPRGCNLAAKIRGRTIQDLSRRGKRIVILLANGNRFFAHLGMSGRLTVAARREHVPKHTHLILRFSDGTDELRFTDARRFGGIHWLGNESGAADLGPEPLAVRAAQLARRLARTRRAVKSALLDQRVIAGLGNIYVDEALFAARIHPCVRASELSLDQIRRLNRAVKRTLRRALRHRGSTLRDFVDANGAGGAYQKFHRVYARENEPCLVCGAPIQRVVLCGRSSHFCPRCQPAQMLHRRQF
ncbi:MAG: bifunctional DNA-formamidopyrimidine glycosylase/DNA-(apurinic or apyrimidinic site) lyase [Tepidisphaeraceae bacterium]